MSRKTFSVETMKDRCNYLCLNSEDGRKEQRQGAINLMTGILHDTGNYKGFGYLNSNDMKGSEFGASVGINTENNVIAEGYSHEEKFAGTDPTRVYYF